MKKSIFSLLCLAGFAFISCSNEKPAAQMPPLPVTAMKVTKGDQPLVLSFNGHTVSELDVMLKAKVAGTIEKQFFTPGDSVKEGDKLFEIDYAKYKALYDSALGNYQAAQANANNANSEFKRVKELKSKNAVSQKDYDIALANLNATNATAKAANAAATSAKLDLEFSSLSAPFSGIVSDNMLDVGAFADKGNDLVRLSKLDPIYVKFGISDVAKLNMDNNLANNEWKKLNPSVSMSLNGKTHTGKLIFIDNVIDNETATVQAKAVFDNPNLEIKPGIYSKIIVNGFSQKDAFRVPQSAVSQDPKGSFVFVAKDGVIEKKYVRIANPIEFDYIIKSGLNDGDILVLDNFKKINIGSKVQIINDVNNPSAMLTPKTEQNSTKPGANPAQK